MEQGRKDGRRVERKGWGARARTEKGRKKYKKAEKTEEDKERR